MYPWLADNSSMNDYTSMRMRVKACGSSKEADALLCSAGVEDNVHLNTV